MEFRNKFQEGNFMKKFTAIFFAALFVLSLTACINKSKQNSENHYYDPSESFSDSIPEEHDGEGGLL